ncbi:MAG: hypothetical protein NC082_02325 [Clostridiales bacterium]|nr:hypothetical protein [Clostridiales bacterium]
MITYHIAVDLGATSGRTILASFDGMRVKMRELSRFKDARQGLSLFL